MNILNISRREKAEDNFKYGKVTVTLGVNELGLLKNALYEETGRNPAEIKNKLLAELQIAFDLLSYGGVDEFMIGQIASNLGVVSDEYLEFRTVKKAYELGTISDEHLDKVIIELKAKEGIS